MQRIARRGGGNFVLTDSSQSSQIFTAGRAEQTVSFIAPAPWTATLEETSRSGLSWVELDKYEGEAGRASISIRILQENTSGKSRYAKITILCGDSRISIEIEQQAEGADPDNPDNPNPAGIKYVDRIDYLLVDNCEKEQKRETVSQAFKYDDRNRVAQIVEEYDLSWKEKGSLLYTLDYTIAGEITVTMTDTSDGGSSLLQKIVAELDEKGRMKEASETTYDEEAKGRLSGEEICTYDSEGRIGSWLSKHSRMGDGNLDTYSENKFFYDADGLLTRYTYYDGYDNDGWEEELPAAQFYPNRIVNDKSNLDFMFYALSGTIDGLEDPQALFPLLRLTGSGFGKYLPETTTAYDDDDAIAGGIDGWPTPNVTIHKSYTYTECTLGEDERLPLGFTTDADGCITQMAYKVPYAEYLCEYDIVVGSEVIYEEMNRPEFPESEKRYKCEIKNRTTTKQRDIVNPVTIDIAYR